MMLFHYVHKNTALHNMDGRIKVLCMILLSLAASLSSGGVSYAILTVAVCTALFVSKISFFSLLKEIKFFLFLITFIFVMNAFTIKGEPIENFPVKSISLEGVIFGAMFAWRMILIVMIGVIVTYTTSLLVFNKVIEWYLRPIPFVPETKVATMVNLTFVFIPVILDQYAEINYAQKARCVESRKNPLKRVLFIILPLMTNTLRKTDELIFAMESRCYSEDRTKAIFHANLFDWIILAITVFVTIFVIIL